MNSNTFTIESDFNDKDIMERYIDLVQRQVDKDRCLTILDDARWVKDKDGRPKKIGKCFRRGIVTRHGVDQVQFEFESRLLRKVLIVPALPEGFDRRSFLDHWDQTVGRLDHRLGVRSRRWTRPVKWVDRRAEWAVGDVIVTGQARRYYGAWRVMFDIRRRPVVGSMPHSLEDLFQSAA